MLKVLVAKTIHRAADEVFKANQIEVLRPKKAFDYQFLVHEIGFDGVAAIFVDPSIPIQNAAIPEVQTVKAIGCVHHDLAAVDGALAARHGLPVITSYEGDAARAAREIAQKMCDFLHMGLLQKPVANEPEKLRHKISYPTLKN